MISGEYLLEGGDVVANAGRRTELAVANAGDRPIQGGAHFHVFAGLSRPLAHARLARGHGATLGLAPSSRV